MTTSMPPRYRFTVADFVRMHEIGIFDEDDRVELIEGIVMALHPVSGPHVWVSGRLNREVHRQTDDDVMNSINNPLFLRPDTLPLVDLAVIRASYNAAELPSASDAVLVGEIADASLDYDRAVKFPLYAQAGIPEAWLFDLVGHWIERHTDPGPNGYRQVAPAGQGERLASTVLPSLTFDVDEVLGPRWPTSRDPAGG
jgi:Uma2 family endonuclease